MFVNNLCGIGDLLWEEEKHWQRKLFTTFYGINNINDLYSIKRLPKIIVFKLMFSIFNCILSFSF